MASDLLFEVRDQYARIRLNRPESGNAVTAPMLQELAALLRQADSDDHVRSVLIAGAGDNFSVGGDVKNFGATLELTPGERRQAYEQRVLAGLDLLSTLDRFSKPLVAMVRGAVAGAGITLALAADFVVGSEDCFFVFAHTKIGLSPDAGLSYFLPRVVGPQKALQLVLAGARVDSAEALRIG